MVFKELPDLVHMYDLSLGKEAIAEMRRKFGNKQLQESHGGIFTEETARNELNPDVVDHAAAIHDELLLLMASIVEKQQTFFKEADVKRDMRRVTSGQMMEIAVTLVVYSIIDDLKSQTVFKGFEEAGITLTENHKDMAFVASNSQLIRDVQKSLETLTRSLLDEFMQIYCKGVYDKAKKDT